MIWKISTVAHGNSRRVRFCLCGQQVVCVTFKSPFFLICQLISQVLFNSQIPKFSGIVKDTGGGSKDIFMWFFNTCPHKRGSLTLHPFNMCWI